METVLRRGSRPSHIWLLLALLPTAPDCANSRGNSPASTTPDTESTVVVGPWGELVVDDILVEPPATALRASMCSTEPPVWVIPGGGMDRLESVLEAARLSDTTRAALRRVARCTGDRCQVHPDLALVDSLAAAERERLYNQLRVFPREPHDLLAAPPSTGRALRPPGRAGSARSHAWGRRSVLLWRGPDGDEALSDFEVLCASLASADDRLQLMRLLTQANGELGALRVRPNTDIDAVARYWARGSGRDSKVASLLASLASKPSGGWVDIVHLLPSFARARVNTYPSATPGAAYNCHYSSFNFFAAQPDESLLDMRQVEQVLRANYSRVAAGEPAQLGDLILFAGSDGAMIHSAVYIAGDLVFTKNGMSSLKPWVFMRRARLEALFGHPTTHLFRLKEGPSYDRAPG